MAQLVVALASCSDAAELHPVLTADTFAGRQVGAVWLGDAAQRLHAEALGLPAGAQGAAAFEPADLTEDSLLLLCGHGPQLQEFALRSRHAGVTLVRWNAGQRDHAPGGRDAERRLTDHLAHAWLCTSSWQRDELRREGCPADRVHVVGTLWPRAAAPTRGAFVWLALEHGHDDAARTAALTERARGAAEVAGLELRSNREALQIAPREQFDLAHSAAAIVTDSAGYQELAAAAGIGCVLLANHTARPETVAAGLGFLAGPDADLQTALALALAAKCDTPYADARTQLEATLDSLAGNQTSGAPVATTAALPSDADHTGRTLGDDEVALAAVAIRSGTLNSTRGTFVPQFEQRFAAWQGAQHAIACTSGSAAVHAALAALQLQPGDEVVTTPITDMGALTPIFYEGAVPVFADVDPTTKNVTAASIEAQLTDRTRAIVVTHLFGLPADLDAIVALADARGIPVVEDCAQAFGATLHGKKVGTVGKLAAFSLQQGKHITSGEGGLVTTDDPALARRVFLFVNKAWGYGDARPDHYFPALNYRMTELQGAVLTAQLTKLDHVIERRRQVAAALRQQLAGLPGLHLPDDPPHGRHVYWKFALDVDAAVVPGGAVALGRGLQEQGIACAPRYVQKPAYACELFTQWRRSPITSLPLQHNARGSRPSPWPAAGELPGAAAALDRVLVLPLNERYRPEHVQRVADAIRRRHEELTRG